VRKLLQLCEATGAGLGPTLIAAAGHLTMSTSDGGAVRAEEAKKRSARHR
jgi:hypothetical protein